MVLHIQLEKIILHSKTGWFEDEHVLGNELELYIDVELKLHRKIKNLNDTLDYVKVYEVARKHGMKNGLLLEKLAVQIADDVALLDKRIQKINIAIKKLQPPIPNFIGNIGISISRKY